MTANAKTKNQLVDENEQLRARIAELESTGDGKLPTASIDVAVPESDELHRITMTSVSDVVLISNDEGQLTYVSPNVHVIFGCSAQTAKGMESVSQLLGDELFDYEDLAITGEIKNIERRIRDVSGRPRDLLVSVKQVFINDGTVLYTCRDITDRINILSELRRLKLELEQEIEQKTRQLSEKSEKYRRLVEGLKDEYFFYATDPQGLVTYVSPSVEGILGYLPEQVVGKNWRALVDLSNPRNQQVEILERERFLGRDRGIYECVVNHANGDQVILECRDSPVHDEQAKVIANEGIAKDITARHKAKEALRKAHDNLELRVQERTIELKQAYDRLRESEARYRSVVEDQTELIVRWLPDGTRTFVNAAYCQYFGKRPDKMVGTNVAHTVAEEDRDAVKRKIESLSVTAPVAVDERRAIRPDGSVAWHQWSDRGFFDNEGKLIEIQSVGRDITERRKAEEESRGRAAARESVSQLSPRERDVMKLVVAGHANKVIARDLDVSIKTVEKHRASVMKKLRVRSVPELVRLALMAKSDVS